MQLRMGLGVSILIIFLLIGLLSSIGMEKACKPVSQLLSQAADETDPQLAFRAKKLWDCRNHLIATLADHTPMDEIDGLFAQALTYANQGNLQEFAAICNKMSSLVDAIYQAHRLTWWNVI